MLASTQNINFLKQLTINTDFRVLIAFGIAI